MHDGVLEPVDDRSRAYRVRELICRRHLMSPGLLRVIRFMMLLWAGSALPELKAESAESYVNVQTTARPTDMLLLLLYAYADCWSESV